LPEPGSGQRWCLNQVLVNDGAEILRYGEYAGYKALREYIAHRLQIHGISISAGEVLITNGAQQAIDLVLNLLTVPGARVAIEIPTYANVIPLLQYHQNEIVEIPMGEEGLDLNHLKEVLQKNPPAFVYTIPNFHNPTGITTSQVHREALISLCEKYRVPVVEDGFEEEMKYFGKVVLPIKSMDKNQVVIYLGTFSKVLFPGIRIGWVAAEKECIRRLTAIKRFSDLSTSTVVQAAVAAFCKQGYYDLHVKRMHRIFRKRMQIALNALKENLPENVSWTKPDGGYTIWVKLARSYTSETAFKNLLVKHGVLVSPGEYYFHGSTPHKYFRLSIASLNEEEIQEGIIRLGKVLRGLS
jgi:DNA-binding transcriptional MocR family regulator